MTDTDKMREAFERDHGNIADDLDMRRLWERNEHMMRWAWQAAQAVPVVGKHIRSIKIPTDTMEQEFQHHYRRGYEAGKASNNAELEQLRKDAERYRWLRTCGEEYGDLRIFNSRGMLDPEALDEEIDAALAAGGNSNG